MSKDGLIAELEDIQRELRAAMFVVKSKRHDMIVARSRDGLMKASEIGTEVELLFVGTEAALEVVAATDEVGLAHISTASDLIGKIPSITGENVAVKDRIRILLERIDSI